MRYLKTVPLNPRTYDYKFHKVPPANMWSTRPTIWFYRGLPASGKSSHAEASTTDANKFGLRYVIICKDDFRAVMPNVEESTIVKYETQAIYGAATAKVTNIYLPNTHFNKFHEDRVRQIAKEIGYDFQILDFTFVPPLECIRRNRVRHSKERVPEEVIMSMFHTNIDYFKPWVCEAYGEVFAEARKKCYGEGLYKPIYVTDLDGTLAIHNGRDPYDWRKANTDIPNHRIADILRKHRTLWGDSAVFYLSARNDNARTVTEEWLWEKVKDPSAGERLYMRSAGDDRRDWVVKLELMDLLIREHMVYPGIIFDDRNQVVEAWRKAGLTCWQVVDGDF